MKLLVRHHTGCVVYNSSTHASSACDVVCLFAHITWHVDMSSGDVFNAVPVVPRRDKTIHIIEYTRFLVYVYLVPHRSTGMIYNTEIYVACQREGAAYVASS